MKETGKEMWVPYWSLYASLRYAWLWLLLQSDKKEHSAIVSFLYFFKLIKKNDRTAFKPCVYLFITVILHFNSMKPSRDCYCNVTNHNMKG